MADTFIKAQDDGIRGALFAKFGTLLGLTSSATDISQVPKEIALRSIAEKRGETRIEFISFWRSGMTPDLSRRNATVARKGILGEYNDSVTKSAIATIRAVPVTMLYDVWFWSKDLDKLNSVAELYLFWGYNNPNLIMQYGTVYPVELDLRFGGIADESTYHETYGANRYFVMRAPVTIEGWVFTLTNAKTVLSITLKLYYREGTPPNNVDILLNTYVIT